MTTHFVTRAQHFRFQFENVMSAVDRSETMVIGRKRLNVAVARSIPEPAKDEKADLRKCFFRLRDRFERSHE